MAKMLEIRACKCLLVLPENDLFGGLKPDILQAALTRGKGFRRAAACENRQAQVDRWQLFEWLKGRRVPENVTYTVETMSVVELREGVIEFLLSMRQPG